MLPSTSDNLIMQYAQENRWGNILNENTFKTLNNNIKILKSNNIELSNNFNKLNTLIDSNSNEVTLGNSNKTLNLLNNDIKINNKNITLITNENINNINNIAYLDKENNFSKLINSIGYMIDNESIISKDNNNNINIGNTSNKINLLSSDGNLYINNSKFSINDKKDIYFQDNNLKNKDFKYNFNINLYQTTYKEDSQISNISSNEDITKYTNSGIEKSKFQYYMDIGNNKKIVMYSEYFDNDFTKYIFNNISQENKNNFKGFMFDITICDIDNVILFKDTNKVYIKNPPFDINNYSNLSSKYFIKNYEKDISCINNIFKKQYIKNNENYTITNEKLVNFCIDYYTEDNQFIDSKKHIRLKLILPNFTDNEKNSFKPITTINNVLTLNVRFENFKLILSGESNYFNFSDYER